MIENKCKQYTVNDEMPDYGKCKEVYESEYEYRPQDGCKLIPLIALENDENT